MTTAKQIRPRTPVFCSDRGKFAMVDRMEGPHAIRLVRDEKGQHHFIPFSWVTAIDDKVHVSRTREQAMREWSTSLKTLVLA